MAQLEGKDAIPGRGPDDARAADPAAAALFELLWESLADLLGTAATATLLRRALKRATPRHGDLKGIVIERKDFAYEYRVPEAWQQTSNGHALQGLRELLRDLQPLLVEMTGPVVVRRLARVRPLRQLGVVPEEESNK